MCALVGARTFWFLSSGGANTDSGKLHVLFGKERYTQK